MQTNKNKWIDSRRAFSRNKRRHSNYLMNGANLRKIFQEFAEDNEENNYLEQITRVAIAK